MNQLGKDSSDINLKFDVILHAWIDITKHDIIFVIFASEDDEQGN